MTVFEYAIYDIKRLCQTEVSRAMLEVLERWLLDENKNNAEAFIPIGHLESSNLDISDYEILDDYEIITGQFETKNGDTYSSEEERDNRLSEIDELVDKISDKIAEVQEIKDELEVRELQGLEKIARLEQSLARLEKKESELSDEKQAIENSDFEYNEIYYCIVTRYYNGVNKELAQSLGFGVLEMYERRGGDQYMFLRGCGMDLTPKYIAYEALEFGRVNEKHLIYFRDPGYMRSVLGDKILTDVVKALNLERFSDYFFGDRSKI